MVRGGNAHFFTYTRIRSRERKKIEGQTNNTNKLGVNQEQRKVSNTTCMCIPDSIYGLTLAWVTSENSTMPLESDSSWLTLAGPYPMLPRLSAPVSGVDCPSVDPRQPLCSPLSCPAATAPSTLQPPTALCWVASSTLIRVPLPLPDTARFHVQESFVWFRAKTDSSALAAYPHSATLFQIGNWFPPWLTTKELDSKN